jgi:hypothetical protein
LKTKNKNGREEQALRRGFCPKKKGGENEREKIVVMCFGVNECEKRKKGSKRKERKGEAGAC